ncbi:MAG: hypothetical protein GX308_00040 [Epulopiscium sp.]|nr:hypothetical protein [Candidatus Epulonipiscium sp.]
MRTIRFSALWIFIFGFVMGTTSYNTLYMHKLDEIIKENEYLSAKLEDSLTKLEKLKTIPKEKETPILNEIYPIIQNNDVHLFPKNEINQYIKILLSNQLGKELNKIDINLIYNALNRRILKYEDGEYKLEIKAIVLTDTMYIYYTIEKTKGGS